MPVQKTEPLCPRKPLCPGESLRSHTLRIDALRRRCVRQWALHSRRWRDHRSRTHLLSSCPDGNRAKRPQAITNILTSIAAEHESHETSFPVFCLSGWLRNPDAAASTDESLWMKFA